MLLHKGEILFRQGELGPLFHVKSGLLKIVRIHEDGHTVLVNIIEPGETIPHHSLITQNPYYGTAIALITSEVQQLPSDEWYNELTRNPEKCLEIARILQS